MSSIVEAPLSACRIVVDRDLRFRFPVKTAKNLLLHFLSGGIDDSLPLGGGYLPENGVPSLPKKKRAGRCNNARL